MMISWFMLKKLKKLKKYNLKKFASFIQAPASQVAGDNYKDVMTDFRDLLKHIDRRKCEITFIKCQQCKPCLNTKVKSQKVSKFVHVIFIILKYILSLTCCFIKH